MLGTAAASANSTRAVSVPSVGGRPISILVVGVNNVTEGNQADSIHLVTFNPKLMKATMLGISYDYWVNIPGHGMGKIDIAYYYGGIQLLEQVVEQITGIHIDYYAVTGFGGIATAVNALGGIKVDVPATVYSTAGGPDIAAGTHKLNGTQSLFFLRARDGLPNGDLSRSCDGGVFLQSILSQYQHTFHTNPSILLNYLAAAMFKASGTALPNVQTNIPFQEMLQLGLAATKMKPGSVTDIVAPGAIAMAGSESIVAQQPALADPIFADMKDNGVLDRQHHGAYTGIPSCP
jgi:LCP family protein required for cell wall assembly